MGKKEALWRIGITWGRVQTRQLGGRPPGLEGEAGGQAKLEWDERMHGWAAIAERKTLLVSPTRSRVSHVCDIDEAQADYLPDRAG